MTFLPEKILIGSRASPLAKAQTRIFIEKFINIFGMEKEKNLRWNFIKTYGDKILNNNSFLKGNKGIFTKELDQAQIEGEIDLSIHSMKDLPSSLPKELEIVAVLDRDDPRDAVYSFKAVDLISLKKNSVVGTSSIRRTMQIKSKFPSLKIKPIRGNVGTRIKKLENDDFDALVLASAGLRRLGISSNFKPISSDLIIPAAGQGIIALIARKNDDLIKTIAKKLNHNKTFFEGKCERLFLGILDGSCDTPIGVNAALTKENGNELVKFKYFVSTIKGTQSFRGDKVFKKSESEKEITKLSLTLKQKL